MEEEVLPAVLCFQSTWWCLLLLLQQQQQLLCKHYYYLWHSNLLLIIQRTCSATFVCSFDTSFFFSCLTWIVCPIHDFRIVRIQAAGRNHKEQTLRMRTICTVLGNDAQQATFTFFQFDLFFTVPRSVKSIGCLSVLNRDLQPFTSLILFLLSRYCGTCVVRFVNRWMIYLHMEGG